MSPSQLFFLRTPAVSISVMTRPSFSIRTSTLSRVVPAISLTITRGSPASQFTMLLLPALRRPTMAMRISGMGGFSSGASSSISGNLLTMRLRKYTRPRPLLALTHVGAPKPRRATSCAADSQLLSSTLLATAITLEVRPRRRNSVATVRSSAITPSFASVTNKIMSASFAAAMICDSMLGFSGVRSTPASSLRFFSVV